MKTICIMCPVGCELDITENDNIITVTGNSCPRGDRYGRQEYSDPKRPVTTLVRTINGKVVSVKTDGLVDKSKIFVILNIIRDYRLSHSVEIGDVIISNIADTGVDIVATSKAEV